MRREEKRREDRFIWLEIAIGAAMCIGLFLFFYLRGFQPVGADVYGHLYKVEFLGERIKQGDFFPLYTEHWYNGFQIFRVWPIFCYYVMAIGYLITGSLLYSYYLLFVTVFAVGYIGFCLIGNREHRYIFIAIGICYFFFPDNIRLMFGEGNIARIFMFGMLPLFFYFFTNLIEYKKSLIPTVIMVAIFVCTHIMLAAMCAIIFSIYGFFLGLKKGTWYYGALAFVLGILLSGIVLVPALLSDAVAGAGTTSAGNRMSDWMQELSLSLSITQRADGLTSCSFGISVVLLAVLAIIFGKRKVGSIIALIFFVLSAEQFLPILEKMPLQQAFWMLRYVQMCYVLICYEWGFLEFKKKPLIALTFVAVLLDAYPSRGFFLTIGEPIEEGAYLEEAAELTSNRLGVVDESSFKSYISYFALEKDLLYVQGWDIQGASTNLRVVYMTEAAEYGYYSYTFRELLELGCDSVIIKKGILPNDFKTSEVTEAAEQYGYTFVSENDTAILYDLKGVDGQFGVNMESDNLAIGSSALYVSYRYPSFVAGSSNAIEDYTYEELASYKKIYLSGFTYEDQEAFEKLLQKLSDAGVEVYVDASDLPQNRYGMAELFDIEVQDIRLEKTGDWTFGENRYDINLPYEWVGTYLTSSSDDVTVENFTTEDLTLGYYASYENIHVIGMSLPYLLMETEGEDLAEVRSLVEEIFAIDDSDQAVSYEIVPMTVTYDNEGITIETDEDVCTNVAYQDNFVSEQEFGVKNALIMVKAGTTRITQVYARFAEGLTTTILGAILTILVWVLLFKKNLDPLVPLGRFCRRVLEMEDVPEDGVVKKKGVNSSGLANGSVDETDSVDDDTEIGVITVDEAVKRAAHTSQTGKVRKRASRG